MVPRRTLAPVLSLLILSSVACSKTQDTAPERKVFGDPPVIQFAAMTPVERTVSCDFTEAWNCSAGQDQACEFDPNGGVGPDGVPCDPNRKPEDFCDDCGSGTPDADPGNPVHIYPGPWMVGGTYQELFFQAKVTDPNSTTDRTDILLVSASYVIPGGTHPEESTLVMLDDGGQNSFIYRQIAPNGIREDCFVNADGTCGCNIKDYGLNSNDVTPNDGLFERRFAVFNLPDQTIRGLLSDCIARERHQAPATVPAGITFDFRIDAVDRSGNITTWPNRPQVSTTRNTYTCSGDQCLCCLLSGRDGSQCGGCTGLVGPRTPGGACIYFFGGGTCPVP